MPRRQIVYFTSLFVLVLIAGVSLLVSCPPEKAEPVRTGTIADEEYEPEEWGKVYPLEYESWLKTKEPRPLGKSNYKRGWDKDEVVYDKLSEYPFMALLYNGWGFGQEYNEPRGHHYMMIDIAEIDKSRTGAGGVCLTCKTPYATKLVEDYGEEFFAMPFFEALDKIPEKHRKLGVACIDCHDNKTMGLRVSRWTIKEGLERIGNPNPDRQEMRSVVCASCHVTYYVPKDANMKSTNVRFPWRGSKWADISIEKIIEDIQSDSAHFEWWQKVTGFKLGYIRHPEFEFYSRNSVHWQAGVACADCHMPYKRVGANKISDHNLMSPLKDDLRACIHCHPEPADWLREQVIAIQDRTVGLMLRAGYATATTAKLFELTHQEQAQGRNIEQAMYDQAKEFYLEAFYRVVFLGAENSVGFHNPTEAGRIAGDAVAFASKSEGLLRQALTKAGVGVPAVISLGLSQYLNNRGTKEKKGKLNFIPEQELKDPSGIQERLLPEQAKGL